MKFFLTLLLVGMGSCWLPAQGLTFCLDHNSAGEPLAPGKEFELDQFGQEVDFLVHAPDELPSGKYFFFIDKQIEDRFAEHDTKSLVSDSARSWMALSYRFDRSGNYRVSFLDSDRQLLFQDTLKVNVLRDVGGPSYYRDAEVIFCFQVREGQPDKALQRTTTTRIKKRPLRVLIRHYRALRTRQITVDVWKDGPEPIYVESLQFKVEPHWKYTQFDYPFRSAGTYFLRIYSENEVWIGTGKIRIEQ